MQVFNCALRILRDNIAFLLIYIVGLSFMGIFMAHSLDMSSLEDVLETSSGKFALVDRDNSSLSHAIEAVLEDRGVAISVEDSTRAFQDAVAKGQTDYLLVIPEGYESSFQEALNAGETVPQMEVVYSYYAADGAYFDEVVNSYLGCVRAIFATNPNMKWEDVLEHASQAASNKASMHLLDVATTASGTDKFVFYLQWSTYTLFAGIVVCVGMLISIMNRADVRRRNLASPLSYRAFNVQLALACALIAVGSSVWTFVLGLLAFPEAMGALSPAGLGLSALSVLCYALMALAFGFMLGQCGTSVLMCNAFGNIFGMLISFLGGAWISLDLLSPEIMAFAHWLPGYWYTDACHLSAGMTGTDLSVLSSVFVDLGVLLLFAAAFLGIGFVAAKRRLQTSEAGGNRAAEVMTM